VPVEQKKWKSHLCFFTGLCIIGFILISFWLSAQVDTLKKALETSEGIEKADILNRLAAYHAPIEPDKSISYATDALSISRSNGDRQLEAEALRHLADSYYYLDNIQEAIIHYKSSAGIYLELEGNTSENYIGRIGDVAYCYDMLHEYGKAFTYYKMNLDNARDAGNESEIAAQLANIGRLYTIWGDYGKAIEYMEEALKLDEKLGVPEILATDYNTIGKIFSYWGEFDKAIEYFNRSLDINLKLGMPGKVAIRLNSIGEVYKTTGEYEKALDYFNRAIKIDRETGNEKQMGVRYNNIAAVYIAMGQLEKARAFIKQAEEIFRKHNDVLNLISVLFDNGRLAILEGSYKKALGHLDEAYRLADSRNMIHKKAQILQFMAEASEKRGNYPEALRYRMMQDSVEDLVFTEQNALQLTAFQAKYEVDQERQRAELLEKDKRIQRKTLIILSVSFSAAILFLAMLLVIFRLRSKTAKQQQELATRKADNLVKELELRNKELALSVMNIIRNNESMIQVADMIQSSADDEDVSDKMQSVIQSLKSLEHETNWEDFEVRFTKVHQDFYKRLDEKFPDLTPNERRLCAFLKLNMTTKEIASITRQSVKSINVARTRLRKKLGIDHSDENMIAFLSRI
jgi:tetratricopeptide (TPR) repeat protein